jgi:hypothetical protein
MRSLQRPGNLPVVFDRERLVVENNATELTSIGELRTLLPEDIDRLLVPSHGAATGIPGGRAPRPCGR